MIYQSGHALVLEDDAGDVEDVVYFCSDTCHQDYAMANRLAYGGWNGCQEVERDPAYPERCAECGDLLPGA